MTETHACESCSMPIESGRYCAYCVDERGELQPFETRFANAGSASRRTSSSENRSPRDGLASAFV
jgi:hypothetical protein